MAVLSPFPLFYIFLFFFFFTHIKIACISILRTLLLNHPIPIRYEDSFAYMEINLILARMLWAYNLKLVHPDMQWEGQSKIYILWRKPELLVEFHRRKD